MFYNNWSLNFDKFIMERVDITKFNKIWIVYNRNSGKQLFASMLARVNELRRLLHLVVGDSKKVQLIDVRKFTELDGIANDIAKEQVDWVIIAGGDGTIRALIERVVNLEYRPYFSVFPAGTVNLVARELLISKEPQKWIKRLVKGVENKVYFGRANGNLFLTVTGIGYDSLIVDSVSEKSKKLLSKFAYVWQGAEMLRKELLRKDWQYEFEVRFDNQKTWHKASTIFVCKSRYYAGRYMLFDDAKLSDSHFNVALFTGKSSADFMRYSMLIGMEAISMDKTIVRRQAKTMEIKCNVVDFPAELDGDVVTTAPLKIEMDSKPLKFLA